MKRFTLYCCLVVILFFTPFSYGAKQLTACYGNFPPYAQLDEANQPKGAVIDLFSAVISELDPAIQVDFVVVPFARCLQMLKSGDADMAPMLAFNESRSDYIQYTQAYGNTSLVAASKIEDVLSYKSIEDFPANNYALIKPRGTIIWPELAKALSEEKFTDVVYPVDHVQAFDMLSQNHGDFVIIEKFNAIYLMKTKRNKQLKIGEHDLYQMPIYFGLSKKSHWRNRFEDINKIIGSISGKPYYQDYRQTLIDSID